jgi:hypothetical protein
VSVPVGRVSDQGGSQNHPSGLCPLPGTGNSPQPRFQPDLYQQVD